MVVTFSVASAAVECVRPSAAEMAKHDYRLRSVDKLILRNQSASPRNLVSCNRLVKKMQASRISRIALQPESLALPRRRRLPGHGIVQAYFIGCAVWRRYLQGYLHKPVARQRKRQFFGMKNSGDTRAILAGEGCLWRQQCTRQQRRHGNRKSHDVSPVRARL